LSSLPRVLIVDSSAESREVLRTLLERQGVAAMETDRPEKAVALAESFKPDLIVLDAESDGSTSGSPTRHLHEQAGRNDTPIVILGKVRQAAGAVTTGQIVAKPYHYAPLLRKIDDLLAAA
jgi:DNA-binding response OmpR family regulator